MIWYITGVTPYRRIRERPDLDISRDMYSIFLISAANIVLYLNISIIFGENLWFWPGRRKIRRYWPLIFSVRIKPGISDYMERLSVLTRWNLSISMSIVRNIMSIRRPLFSEIVSSVQWWKSLIKIILVFSNELAKNAKIFAKKIWWFDSNRISLRSLLRGTRPKRGTRKVDWNNEEQVQFISTKKRVQALISLEKFISTREFRTS